MTAKLIIWLTAGLTISIFFFGELWAKLPQWLTPGGLQRHGVFHWGVLGLCVLWLWLKRKDILSKIQDGKPGLPYILAGVVLVALSIFLPRSEDFLVFLLLLGWLGALAIIFAGAGIIPSILLAIYGFSLAFPIFMTRWLGEPPAILMANVVTAIARMLGLLVTTEGLVLRIPSDTGDVVSTAVVTGCVGYITIGVFIALFALMMLDIRLPWQRAWYIFLVGLAGTWLQNIIRILVSVAAGHYWGLNGLEAMHYNISYVIFPLWYALFAYIYLRQARLSSVRTTQGVG